VTGRASKVEMIELVLLVLDSGEDCTLKLSSRLING
jgi:hypothetical protein